jgi:DHA1 family bicyclomycin/chloramphenicol resistance-like MFS transporter
LALSRHHEAAGTAAALLGAAQFGIGAAVSPVVGLLGNDELALAVVMTTGVVVALLALVLVISRGTSGLRGRTDAAPA